MTLCLLTTVVALLLVLSIHLHQDVKYWQHLEEVAEKERSARLSWEEYSGKVKKEAETQISEISKERQHLLTKSAKNCEPCNHKCPPCARCHTPNCPKCKECTPCDTKASGGSSSTSSLSLVSSSRSSDDIDPKTGVSFKIFVYDLPVEFHSELKKQQRRCVSDQYGTEIRIHEDLLKSPIRTRNPEEADFFYVPIYGECYLFRENQKSSREAMPNTNKWYRKALSIVVKDYPYWNRTQGRDHIWTFPGARGPHIFKDWKRNIKKSIFLTPEGDRSLSEQFNTWKDIVIPGLEADQEFWSGKLRNQDFDRDIFAFFKGTIHNRGGKSYSRGLRIVLEKLFKDEKDIVFKEQTPDCNRQCYKRMMRRSQFCLCPRGWSPWTLRAYQAMMVGCIPVVMADEIEFPYENSLDWTKLSVKIAEADVNKTLEILRGIPQEVIEEKREAIDKVWRMVAWQKPTKPGDAFHSVMKELEGKKRRMKLSSYTFWN